MLSGIAGDSFWSTGAEVIVGLVVAVVFVDLSATESAEVQLRWYSRLRIAALVAIVGGLGACLTALAYEGMRTVAAAVVVAVSVVTLAGLMGTRLELLRRQASRRRAIEAREANDDHRTERSS